MKMFKIGRNPCDGYTMIYLRSAFYQECVRIQLLVSRSKFNWTELFVSIGLSRWIESLMSIASCSYFQFCQFKMNKKINAIRVVVDLILK